MNFLNVNPYKPNIFSYNYCPRKMFLFCIPYSGLNCWFFEQKFVKHIIIWISKLAKAIIILHFTFNILCHYFYYLQKYHGYWGRINNLTDLSSIYKFGLSGCLFVSNKRRNGWTDRAQIFCGTSRDHREGLWMIKIKNKCVLKVFNFVKKLNSLKSANFFKMPQIFFLLCF